MADTNNGGKNDEKGFLGLSKTTQKWIGIGLLAGGLALGTYAIVKKSKKSKGGKALNGVKKTKKRISSHKSSKKRSKKSSRAKYLLKGF